MRVVYAFLIAINSGFIVYAVEKGSNVVYFSIAGLVAGVVGLLVTDD